MYSFILSHETICVCLDLCEQEVDRLIKCDAPEGLVHRAKRTYRDLCQALFALGASEQYALEVLAALEPQGFDESLLEERLDNPKGD